MTKGFVGGAAFIVGAALSSLVTWKLVQKKYAKEAEEEIDEMRAYYRSKKENKSKETQPIDKIAKKISRQASDMAIREGYVHYSSVDRKENNEETDFKDIPYLIDEQTFYEDEDYTKIEWTYYADGILADENEDPIKTKEIDETITMELLGHFGNASEIYVRNERLKANYLINKDKRNYEDVYGEV